MDITKIKIHDLLAENKIISIIGMEKNVGKTTTLNYIINESRENFSLGITSIGRDGEDTDIVTATQKPLIYVEKGTIIATAKKCLFNSDITKQIIKATGINTPMGEVIICKALSDGFVDLAGPSISSELRLIAEELLKLSCRYVLIDGAISRKSLASPIISDATIIATGASLNNDMNIVIKNTKLTTMFLSLENEEDTFVVKSCKETISKYVLLNTVEKKYECFDENPVINALDRVINGKNKIFIRGALTDSILEQFIKKVSLDIEISLIVEDGTKIFITENSFNKLLKRSWNIKVLKTIKVLFITANPTSPFGYSFEREAFFEGLKSEIKLPILDVVGGEMIRI